MMKDAPAPPKVLIVDDDADIRHGIAEVFERAGFRAGTAPNAAAMDRALEVDGADLVVLDLMMPGEDGLSAARRLAARGGPPVIMLSALGDDADRIIGKKTTQNYLHII